MKDKWSISSEDFYDLRPCKSAFLKHFYFKFFLKKSSILSNGIIFVLSYKST